MAPFIIVWALVWALLQLPAPPGRPLQPHEYFRLVVTLCFVIYCIFVLLVDSGSLHLPLGR